MYQCSIQPLSTKYQCTRCPMAVLFKWISLWSPYSTACTIVPMLVHWILMSSMSLQTLQQICLSFCLFSLNPISFQLPQLWVCILLYLTLWVLNIVKLFSCFNFISLIQHCCVISFTAVTSLLISLGVILVPFIRGTIIAKWTRWPWLHHSKWPWWIMQWHCISKIKSKQ